MIEYATPREAREAVERVGAQFCVVTKSNRTVTIETVEGKGTFSIKEWLDMLGEWVDEQTAPLTKAITGQEKR